MNTYVLDTSVAVAWYLDEAFSGSARRWQERLLQGKIALIVPGLHFLEFANVLRTLVMRREVQTDMAQDIYELHREAPLEIVEPDPRTLLTIALKYEATAYDAAYISISLSQNAHLVTAEKTTTPWITKLGSRVETVR